MEAQECKGGSEGLGEGGNREQLFKGCVHLQQDRSVLELFGVTLCL